MADTQVSTVERRGRDEPSVADIVHDGQGVVERVADIVHDGQGVVERVADIVHDGQGVVERVADIVHDGQGVVERVADIVHDGQGVVERVADNYDLADDLEDVDFEDDGDVEDNDDWETEDEMEAEVEQDDSELTFSKHTGHKDSVTCVCFSHDSALVASGDMSGLIKWLEWHPCAPVLLAGTDDGNMWMWKVPGGECKTFPSPACHANGKILPDGKRAVVGYEDGSVRVWDLKQGNALHVVKGRDSHQGAVTCLASNKDGSLVVTGSVDGSAKLINTVTGKAGIVAHRSGEESSAWWSTCGLDGALRQWDARSGNLVSEYRGHAAEWGHVGGGV
ncbi:hypothetical protein CRUP_003482 [Coryphaenoides rupestris]|nr:hypothetical protein CRUP_003482 [Coryphaenoides rupestris]